MRHFFTKSLAMFLSFSLLSYAQGNTFNRVRYNGGSVASKVDPKEWGNKLTVTSDAITLDLKDGQKLVIAPKSVTSLSYGQEAHRRVGTMVALAILVAPVALFGLFHKTRLHYIGIQYSTPDTKNAGILLQGDKDNYRAMLVALQGVTAVPVEVGEKERGSVPVGVKTSVTKESADTKNTEARGDSKTPEARTADSKPVESTPAASPTPAAEASAAPAAPTNFTADSVGTVVVTTTPEGAEVSVDGQFYGNGPVTLKLKPGKHTVAVKMAGYKDWSREISTDSGSDAHLTATLEKSE